MKEELRGLEEEEEVSFLSQCLSVMVTILLRQPNKLPTLYILA